MGTNTNALSITTVSGTAIAVDAIDQNIFGQHLYHADLAGPGPCCGQRVKIATFEKLKAELSSLRREMREREGGVLAEASWACCAWRHSIRRWCGAG